LFLDLFGIIFLVFLITEINLSLKFVIESNLFLFQIILFLILGVNLIFYYFFQEESYKYIIDSFFSLPWATIFSILISLIFLTISFYCLVNALKNTFFSFLLTYANLTGYILLAYYLTEKENPKRILHLRCLGGTLFLLSSISYTLLIPSVV
jgi:hypothetical protein